MVLLDIDAKSDGVSVDFPPQFELVVKKEVGVAFQLDDIPLTISRKLSPKVRLAFPDATELVSICNVHDQALKKAGMHKGDLFLDPNSEDESSLSRPLSQSQLIALISDTVGESSITFLMTRKKEWMKAVASLDLTASQSHGGMNQQACDTSLGDTCPTTPLDTELNSSNSCDDATAVAADSVSVPVVDASHDNLSATAALALNVPAVASGIFHVERIEIAKKPGEPIVALGMSVAFRENQDAQHLYPGCAGFAYVQRIETGFASDKAVLMGDILLAPCTGTDGWTLMNVAQFHENMAASIDQDVFEFYVGRKIPTLSEPTPELVESSCAVEACIKPAVMSVDGVPAESAAMDDSDDTRKRSFSSLATDDDDDCHDEVCKRPKHLCSDRLDESDSHTAPTHVESASDLCSVLLKKSDEDGTKVPPIASSCLESKPNFGKMICEACAWILKFILPENEALHKECQALVRHLESGRIDAMEKLNSMQQYDPSLKPVVDCTARALDVAFSSLYNESLYPKPLVPTINPNDVAALTKLGIFADGVRAQSAALDAVKIELKAEEERLYGKLNCLSDTYGAWIMKFEKNRLELGHLRNEALDDFKLTCKKEP